MATKAGGSNGNGNGNGKAKAPAGAAVNLIAGGGAGMMEALVCHPLGIFPPPLLTT